jgi:anti-sigma B factor antagonist
MRSTIEGNSIYEGDLSIPDTSLRSRTIGLCFIGRLNSCSRIVRSEGSFGGLMPLVIASRIVSGVVVVDLSGRLCVLDRELSPYIKRLLEEGYREIILNLADLSYVDSSGLGQFINIWSSIRDKAGSLTFLRPTDHVRRLLQMTKLDTVFHTAEDAEAIENPRKN